MGCYSGVYTPTSLPGFSNPIFVLSMIAKGIRWLEANNIKFFYVFRSFYLRVPRHTSSPPLSSTNTALLVHFLQAALFPRSGQRIQDARIPRSPSASSSFSFREALRLESCVARLLAFRCASFSISNCACSSSTWRISISFPAGDSSQLSLLFTESPSFFVTMIILCNILFGNFFVSLFDVIRRITYVFQTFASP